MVIEIGPSLSKCGPIRGRDGKKGTTTDSHTTTTPMPTFLLQGSHSSIAIAPEKYIQGRWATTIHMHSCKPLQFQIGAIIANEGANSKMGSAKMFPKQPVELYRLSFTPVWEARLEMGMTYKWGKKKFQKRKSTRKQKTGMDVSNREQKIERILSHYMNCHTMLPENICLTVARVLLHTFPSGQTHKCSWLQVLKHGSIPMIIVDTSACRTVEGKKCVRREWARKESKEVKIA